MISGYILALMAGAAGLAFGVGYIGGTGRAEGRRALKRKSESGLKASRRESFPLEASPR